MRTSGEEEVSRRNVSASWLLAVLLALVFVGVGAAKLAGAPAMVAIFDKVGIGQWFRFLTGTLEIVGGISVLIPSSRLYAAILLCFIMLGAIGSHLFTALGGNPAPPIALLSLSAATAWLERRKASKFMPVFSS